MQQFIAKQNAELLRERLRIASDPTKVATIREFLREAEAKLTAISERVESSKDASAERT